MARANASGEWRRIHPVQFRQLRDEKRPGKQTAIAMPIKYNMMRWERASGTNEAELPYFGINAARN